jgi:uncharacterized transporter YbjL
MALTTGQTTGVYIGLICAALVLSTILILTMSLNITIFLAIFSIYLVGSFAYLFAYLIMNRAKLTGDIKYTISDYMTLFNMILSLFIFVMCFVLPVMKEKKPSMGYQIFPA